MQVASLEDRRFGRRGQPIGDRRTFIMDVRRTRRQDEIFSLIVRADIQDSLEFVTVDVRPDLRHLLLLARAPATNPGDRKLKILCGHDERHWFIATIPNARSVSSVRGAMDELKPQVVRASQRAHGVKSKDWHHRRNAGYIRQGEWFFIPCPDFSPPDIWYVLHNEPIRRSGGTPHMVETLYRTRGETVYVHAKYPNGLTEAEYRELIERDPMARKMSWQVMQRNATVYAMGKVRHPDHKTIRLPFWHQVVMSAETRTQNGNVVFLD